MFENHLYDLMNQMVQEHKSLWRIKNHYNANAASHPDLVEFWERMMKDKEEHIKEMKALMQKHCAA